MSFLSSLIGYMSTIIQFKDINIKEALLTSSDINPDGTREITYVEANNSNVDFAKIKAAINSDGTGNIDITSFNELKYFRLGSAIPSNMFKGCVNLKEIEFPYVSSVGGANPLCTMGTDVLDGTSIEVFKLFMNALYCSTNSSNFGTMSSLEEVWVKGVTLLSGKVFTKTQMPNIERIVIDNIKQWVTLGSMSGLIQPGSSNPRPSVSEKASLYTENNGVLTLITEANIPNDVTALTHYAFAYIKNLTKITLNSNVTCGDHCFEGLPETTTIENTYHITAIGDSCFKDCKALGITNIPENTTTLGTDSFLRSSIEKIISTKLKQFNYRALKGSSIRSIYIELDTPGEVISFQTYPGEGYEPCANCTSLTSVYLKPVTIIGYSAFANCTSLQTVTCVGLQTLYNAFRGCTSLTTFNASTLKDIGNGAFEGDVLLENINFDLSLCTNIGTTAFKNCAKIRCPNEFTALTSIGASAFTGCLAPINSSYVILNTAQKVTFTPVTGSFSQYVTHASPFPTGVTIIYVPDSLITQYIGTAELDYEDGDTDWKKVAQVNSLVFKKYSEL